MRLRKDRERSAREARRASRPCYGSEVGSNGFPTWGGWNATGLHRGCEEASVGNCFKAVGFGSCPAQGSAENPRSQDRGQSVRCKTACKPFSISVAKGAACRRRSTSTRRCFRPICRPSLPPIGSSPATRARSRIRATTSRWRSARIRSSCCGTGTARSGPSTTFAATAARAFALKSAVTRPG